MELFYRNTFKRGIDILRAVGITVYKSSFFAKNLAAVFSSCSESAVLALGRYVIAEIFLFCHRITFLSWVNYYQLLLYHKFFLFSIEKFNNNKIVIINKNTDGIGEF